MQYSILCLRSCIQCVWPRELFPRHARALDAGGVLAPEEAVRPHVLARLHVDADAEPRPRAQGDGRRERNAAESQKGLQGWTSTVCYSELTRSSMTTWGVPYPVLPPPSVVPFCPGLRRSPSHHGLFIIPIRFQVGQSGCVFCPSQHRTCGRLDLRLL